jgi:hypothetical protein
VSGKAVTAIPRLNPLGPPPPPRTPLRNLRLPQLATLLLGGHPPQILFYSNMQPQTWPFPDHSRPCHRTTALRRRSLSGPCPSNVQPCMYMYAMRHCSPLSSALFHQVLLYSTVLFLYTEKISLHKFHARISQRTLWRSANSVVDFR